MADGLEARRDDVLALADRETALGERLAVEFVRTCYQLRFYAEVCLDGGYLEVSIDHAGVTPMGRLVPAFRGDRRVARPVRLGTSQRYGPATFIHFIHG